MILRLNDAEVELLDKHGISVRPESNYTEDEALDLLDQVRDLEALYAQRDTEDDKALFKAVEDLGDSLFKQIE